MAIWTHLVAACCHRIWLFTDDTLWWWSDLSFDILTLQEQTRKKDHTVNAQHPISTFWAMQRSSSSLLLRCFLFLGALTLQFLVIHYGIQVENETLWPAQRISTKKSPINTHNMATSLLQAPYWWLHWKACNKVTSINNITCHWTTASHFHSAPNAAWSIILLPSRPHRPCAKSWTNILMAWNTNCVETTHGRRPFTNPW
jgi:hypothetical protein